MFQHKVTFLVEVFMSSDLPCASDMTYLKKDGLGFNALNYTYVQTFKFLFICKPPTTESASLSLGKTVTYEYDFTIKATAAPDGWGGGGGSRQTRIN